MKKPTKRSGASATAAATDSSSPGTLAMSAARCTCWRSSSATHRRASASTDSGASHCSVAQIASTASVVNRPCGSSRASVSKKRGEKKWQ